MYLSFSQKRKILKSFMELSEQVDKYGRTSYKFEGSNERRKTVACEFSYTGNGYVYGANLPDYANMADERGWVSVRDFSSTQLIDIVSKAINSISNYPREVTPQKSAPEQETEFTGFEHRIIRNLIGYKLYELKEKWFWEKQCKGFKSGLYFYQLDTASIPYPFSPNEVFYIGKAVNLPERLRHHFTVDNRKRLVDDERSLEWFYQNYYLSKNYSFNIRLFSLAKSEIDKYELLCIGMFIIKFGAAPLCNSIISREKFKTLYQNISEVDKNTVTKIIEFIT
ncbi:MAG: hypothetical protein FH756_10200 [Firmicutes bacterium]|nr:hypothetical protein [Bacillota bacterium]